VPIYGRQARRPASDAQTLRPWRRRARHLPCHANNGSADGDTIFGVVAAGTAVLGHAWW